MLAVCLAQRFLHAAVSSIALSLQPAVLTTKPTSHGRRKQSRRFLLPQLRVLQYAFSPFFIQQQVTHTSSGCCGGRDKTLDAYIHQVERGPEQRQSHQRNAGAPIMVPPPAYDQTTRAGRGAGRTVNHRRDEEDVYEDGTRRSRGMFLCSVSSLLTELISSQGMERPTLVMRWDKSRVHQLCTPPSHTSPRAMDTHLIIAKAHAVEENQQEEHPKVRFTASHPVSMSLTFQNPSLGGRSEGTSRRAGDHEEAPPMPLPNSYPPAGFSYLTEDGYQPRPVESGNPEGSGANREWLSRIYIDKVGADDPNSISSPTTGETSSSAD